jgi:hypothetical protein
MRAAPATRRKTLATIALKTALAAIDLRLRPRDERRQAINAATIPYHGLRLGLWLELRLLALFAVVFAIARLVLVSLLIGLPLALVVSGIVVPLHERLRLDRDETGLLPKTRKAVVVVTVIGGRFGLEPGLRLVLAELLLRGSDQTEIMFGMLVVVLGRDRVAGRTRVARKLHVFLGDVGCGPADFDVRPIRLEYPGHRVLATPVVVIVVVVPVTHPLVVLTVSHVVPLFQP